MGTDAFCLSRIQGGESRTNYLISLESGHRYVLHLTDSHLQLYQRASAEIHDYLAKAGIPVAKLISGPEFVPELGGVVEIYTFIDGIHADVFSEEQAYAFGEFLGRMHLCLSMVTDSPTLQEFGVGQSERRLLRSWAHSKNDLTGILSWLQTLVQNRSAPSPWVFIRALWCRLLLSKQLKSIPAGFNHRDLNSGNLFFGQKTATQSNEVIGVIDFEKIGKCPYLYDIADAACRSVCLTPAGDQFNLDNLSRMLEGYRKIRALSEAELSLLPQFIYLRSRFLLWRKVLRWHRSDSTREAYLCYSQDIAQKMRQLIL